MNATGDQLDFNFAADDLLEFPRDLGEEGWFQFHADRRNALQHLEQKFGIPLNSKVRLRLQGCDEEHIGRLTLDTLLLPASGDERIRLRLGTITFENTDIESCQVLPE